ncbi:Hypothetical predicted protein [Mytilus galloprovincialis]|uniref:Mab-21-like HhH/H2TH-like domain-containing protein n=1 Tax=Mytilus galloprovincialis TaxID=29158 RepID=A0A8B6C9P5_MYTGA|nr:Hypothetical predicted protein [Mytilus galloprovincialis]VDI79649.1 Hypothetical predicted protein [Mytilus galloprovincialis]
MNTNSERTSNQGLAENGNIHEMRKRTYWEKYGVKRFPYRGRRRFTPNLDQHFDGQISITNDVFGLTIQQFERTFRACLGRRKQNSQRILNLRYPVKSSNKYLEYLENCTGHIEGYVLWPGLNVNNVYLYEQLVQIVGKERDIRHRQRLFLLKDIIESILDISNLQYITSGSISEGLDLPGSDLDIMLVIGDVEVVNRAENIKFSRKYTKLIMETDPLYPGFTRLKLAADDYHYSYRLIKDSLVQRLQTNKSSFYVSTFKFVQNIQQITESVETVLHGPCLSDLYETMDVAYCLRCKSFPYNASNWINRHRKHWPPNEVIDTIVKNGCLLVPVGPKAMTNDQLLWRLSFSVAEKQLVHSFNYTQLLCYGLLKLTLKHIINKQHDVKDLLCSYFLKTTLFWVSEKVSIETFQLANIFICFFLCLDTLSSFVNNCYCPNYFIPEQNMFQGKVNMRNNKRLLSIIHGIERGGTAGLISNFVSEGAILDCPAPTFKCKSSTQLDFVFYKYISKLKPRTHINNCYRVVIIAKSFLQSESSIFVQDICKWWIDSLNHFVVQLLPRPFLGQNVKNKQNRYHKHLLQCLQTDAVNGWLLYASFYYVIGQYKVTLRITDYVLSKCTHDKLYTGFSTFSQDMINKYAKNICTKNVTLNEKAKLATINYFTYMKRSSLIPVELSLEVENNELFVPPVVLTHCLRVLCFNHLGETFNTLHALQDLNLTVREKYFITSCLVSETLTILGVCYEVSGDIDSAYKCYDKVSRIRVGTNNTAEIRKKELLKRRNVRL